MTNEIKKAISLKEVLENDSYIIPRYQRNYAWGEKEISQLIRDIDEYFESESESEKCYYLGSLICFEGKDENGHYYELIDGQQRHTTITLINLVLKNWNSHNVKIIDTVAETNLKFSSRKNVQNYIEKLYQTKPDDFNKDIMKFNISETNNFESAIETIYEELNNLDKEITDFANDFYNRVFLFRVEVPEDTDSTDLNHYFEIINNRGEQLEKHEIVKANLMSKINQQDAEQKKQDQKKFANKQPRSKTAGYFAPFMKTHHFMVPINSLKRGKPRGNALRDYMGCLF